MTKKKALISTYRAVDANFRKNDAKLCFLWFEGMIFEDIGPSEKDAFVNNLLEGDVKQRDRHIIHDLVEPASSIIGRPTYQDLMKMAATGYPRWGDNHERYDYPEPENSYQFAHNQLLRAIEHEHGVASIVDGYEVEQAEGRARVAVDAVSLWDRVNSHVPCLLQASADEDIAVRATRSFGRDIDMSDTSYSLFQNKVPSLETVTWKDIIDIKLSGAFNDLQEKISDITAEASGDPAVAQTKLDEYIMSAMDQIVERYKPKTLMVSILSALGNAPVPGLNPVGLFTSVRDVASEMKKKDDFGWLYMLRELQKRGRSG